MFAGLRAEHGADALVFAVMEGVAFSFADGVDVLDAAGARPVRPLLVGGGARSEFWGQMIADVDRPFDRSRFRRGSRRGARRGPARHACRRRGTHRGGVRASAGPARVQAGPGAGRDPCATPQALSRTLSGREGGADNLENRRERVTKTVIGTKCEVWSSTSFFGDLPFRRFRFPGAGTPCRFG